MQRILFSLIVAAPIVCAADHDALAEAGVRLQAALEKEVLALESIQDPAEVNAALDVIRSSRTEQKNLFSVDEKDFWLFIENSISLKEGLVELLERLSIQYDRMLKNDYFDSSALRELYAPQIEVQVEAPESSLNGGEE